MTKRTCKSCDMIVCICRTAPRRAERVAAPIVGATVSVKDGRATYRATVQEVSDAGIRVWRGNPFGWKVVPASAVRPEPRYTFFDRAAGQATSLRTFSAVNPRYAVVDSYSGEIVDNFVSAKAARGTAADMNAGLY